MKRRKFKSLWHYCKWRMKHDPEYAAICGAIRKGYRGSQNPFVMSAKDAIMILKD